MSQAAMNTVMGLGVVFVVLIFLTFVIGQLHWIPDMLGRKGKSEGGGTGCGAGACGSSRSGF